MNSSGTDQYRLVRREIPVSPDKSVIKPTCELMLKSATAVPRLGPPVEVATGGLASWARRNLREVAFGGFAAAGSGWSARKGEGDRVDIIMDIRTELVVD